MREGRFFSGQPTPIGEVLAEYFRKRGISPQIRAYSSLLRFEEWFPGIAPVCHPVKFERGVLYLEIYDPLYTPRVKAEIPAIRKKFQEEGLSVERVKIQCR
ncbi:MAG: DciA family protein [Candidatus Caldatribacteriaceae bacterium]